jgi:hypothetical protein
MAYSNSTREIWIRLRGFGFFTIHDFNDWEHANAVCDRFKALAEEILEIDKDERVTLVS